MILASSKVKKLDVTLSNLWEGKADRDILARNKSSRAMDQKHMAPLRVQAVGESLNISIDYTCSKKSNSRARDKRKA